MLIVCNEVPVYATEGAACFDLKAAEAVLIPPGCVAKIPTGVKMAIPPGHVGELSLRSGGHDDLLMVNAPGKIDSDYRGEIKVKIRNCGIHPIMVPKGERIVQMEIRETVKARFNQVKELPETARGEGGFGSTGKN